MFPEPREFTVLVTQRSQAESLIRSMGTVVPLAVGDFEGDAFVLEVRPLDAPDNWLVRFRQGGPNKLQSSAGKTIH